MVACVGREKCCLCKKHEQRLMAQTNEPDLQAARDAGARAEKGARAKMTALERRCAQLEDDLDRAVQVRPGAVCCMLCSQLPLGFWSVGLQSFKEASAGR